METPKRPDEAMMDGEPNPGTPPVKQVQTWITPLLLMICIGIHIGLLMRDDRESWEALARFGYLPAARVWEGGWWALVSSAFVHLEIWHVAFNMYWLWMLGRRLENAIGWWRYLAFYLVAAFVSSAFQLGVSGETGIGASGAVYALFGFMWVTRQRYPDFAEVIDARTVNLFMVWLVGCIVVTQLKIFNVGNAAHVSGLIFGAAVGEVFAGRHRKPALAGSAALVLLSLVPLFWCPWSVPWLQTKAYKAHAAEQYESAIGWYDRVLDKDPQNAWAYFNRGSARQSTGDMEGARQDLEKAFTIDPSMKTE